MYTFIHINLTATTQQKRPFVVIDTGGEAGCFCFGQIELLRRAFLLPPNLTFQLTGTMSVVSTILNKS